MGPETKHVRAGDVVVGDRIAFRNRAGGFVRWLSVTETLRRHVIGTADGGDYIVSGADEIVEVARARSSSVENVERVLRDALRRAVDSGFCLIYGGPTAERGTEGKVTGVSVLAALLPHGSEVGSLPDLACAVAHDLGVSECVAKEIAYGWECAPPGYILGEWNELGWRLHCEFKPQSAR